MPKWGYKYIYTLFCHGKARQGAHPFRRFVPADLSWAFPFSCSGTEQGVWVAEGNAQRRSRKWATGSFCFFLFFFGPLWLTDVVLGVCTIWGETVCCSIGRNCSGFQLGFYFLPFSLKVCTGVSTFSPTLYPVEVFLSHRGWVYNTRLLTYTSANILNSLSPLLVTTSPKAFFRWRKERGKALLNGNDFSRYTARNEKALHTCVRGKSSRSSTTM